MTSFTTSHTRLRASLLDAAICPDDVEAWLEQASRLPPHEILKAATSWAWEGIPAHDAVQWHLNGWEPRRAVIWWLLGFTPAQASFVRDALTVASGPTTAVDDWLSSGLSSSDIVLCVAAGVPDAAQAKHIAGRLDLEPSLRGSLTMRAALRGADIALLRATAS